MKLITYIFSADTLCSNPSLFLLSTFVDNTFTRKIITFVPVPPLGWEKNTCLSNPIPYPELLYLSISAFLVKLTAPNKQFSNVG